MIYFYYFQFVSILKFILFYQSVTFMLDTSYADLGRNVWIPIELKYDHIISISNPGTIPN